MWRERKVERESAMRIAFLPLFFFFFHPLLFCNMSAHDGGIVVIAG